MDEQDFMEQMLHITTMLAMLVRETFRAGQANPDMTGVPDESVISASADIAAHILADVAEMVQTTAQPTFVRFSAN